MISFQICAFVVVLLLVLFCERPLGLANLIEPCFSASGIASNVGSGDKSGMAIDFDQDRMVISASQDNPNGCGLYCGSIYMYRQTSPGVWTETMQWYDSVNGALGDHLGARLDLDGTHIALGVSQRSGGRGVVLILRTTDLATDDWALAHTLTAGDPQTLDYFGGSIAFDDLDLYVGAWGENAGGIGSQAGSAYMYQASCATCAFDFKGKLIALDASNNFRFGQAGAIDQQNLAIGSDDANNQGAVYIFTETANNAADWSQQLKLTASDVTSNYEFGRSLSLSGLTLVVGSKLAGTSQQGKVYIFTQTSQNAADWTELMILQPTEVSANDWFGSSVGVSGSFIAVSAYYKDYPNMSSGGAVYIYEESALNAGDWVQTNRLNGTSATSLSPRFGEGISVDNHQVFVGSPGDDTIAFDSGAWYYFSFDCDDCDPDQCLHGTCIDQLRAYDCNCGNSGWEGLNCAFSVDDCASSPCMHGGTCTDAHQSYLCECTGTGYSGSECQDDVDDCNPEPCLHGTCSDTGANSYYCNCGNSGWEGTDCELNIDDCASFPCLNGASCTDAHKSYSCDCGDLGFTGNECQTDIDDCSSSPCLHGSCTDIGANSYVCDCADTGWSGLHCEINVNDCQSSPCVNGGTCTDEGVKLYSCACDDTGYEGFDCESDIDDCASSPCANDGVCTDAGVHAFSCDCANTGFEGTLCEIDVDDCASSPCLNEGVCSDSGANLFVCDCTGTGYGGAICDLLFENCDATPPCVNGMCVDSAPGEFMCTCDAGFTGTRCELDVDDCASSPCSNSGTCTDSGIDAFVCDCAATGFTGETCTEDVDDCMPTPCLNDGSCLDAGTNSFYCDCSGTGFSGDICDEAIDTSIDCASGPCEHGTCADTEITYVCTCDSGYVGLACDMLEPCISNPCANGATCSSAGPTYLCNCASGFEGADCSLAIVQVIDNNVTFSSSSLDSISDECERIDRTIASILSFDYDGTVDEDLFLDAVHSILLETLGGVACDYELELVPNAKNDAGTVYVYYFGVDEEEDANTLIDAIEKNEEQLAIHVIVASEEEDMVEKEGDDKNDDTVLIIIIALVAVCVLASGAAFYMYNNRHAKTLLSADGKTFRMPT